MDARKGRTEGGETEKEKKREREKKKKGQMAIESRFELILCLLQPLFAIVFGLPNKVVVVMAITSWHCPDAM